METSLKSKMTVLMLEVGRMKNGKEELQRQFELLYSKISQLKDEFDSPPSYDSSGNNSDSESNSDNELHFEMVNNVTAASGTKLIHDEEGSTNSFRTKEKSNFNAINDEAFNSTKLQEETDTNFEIPSNNLAPVDVIENEHVERPSTTISIPTKIGDLEDTDNDNENKVHEQDQDHNCTDIFCNEHDDSKSENGDTVEMQADENITTVQKDVIKAENPSSAIQDMFVGTPHNVNSTESAKIESDTNEIDAEAKEIKAQRCTAKHYFHKTRLFMFNIQPRRRLHQLTAVRSAETEEYCSERSNQEENPTESVDADSLNDKPNDASALTMAIDNFTTEISGRTDMSRSLDTKEVDAFSFISVEDGLISFCVKLDNYCTDSSNDSDDISSNGSETDLDFLDVQDGYITFKAISEAYNLDICYNDSICNEDDDIFIDEETYGIEALFKTAHFVPDRKTENIDESTADFDDDEYLEGLTRIFDEVDSIDKVKTDHNRDDIKTTYQAETNATCNAMSSGPQHEAAASVDESADISFAKAKSNLTEVKSRSSEYSFAGVMLLNALPSVLTSSILSVFSNPAFGFTFYKPVPLTSCSRLTSSDFAKLSFSSQELPFKKLTGLSFGDNESQFETLSTCSTSSKESSRTESVCES